MTTRRGWFCRTVNWTKVNNENVITNLNTNISLWNYSADVHWCWWLRMNIKVNYCCPFYGFNHFGDFCENLRYKRGLRGKIWDSCWILMQILTHFLCFLIKFFSVLFTLNYFIILSPQKSTLKFFFQHKSIFKNFYYFLFGKISKLATIFTFQNPPIFFFCFNNNPQATAIRFYFT